MERRFPDRADTIYPYLARILEVPTRGAAATQLSGLTPQALQQRMLEAFGECIRARARERPLVLVWEVLGPQWNSSRFSTRRASQGAKAS
jgi:hypothetical protein